MKALWYNLDDVHSFWMKRMIMSQGRAYVAYVRFMSYKYKKEKKDALKKKLHVLFFLIQVTANCIYIYKL